MLTLLGAPPMGTTPAGRPRYISQREIAVECEMSRSAVYELVRGLVNRHWKILITAEENRENANDPSDDDSGLGLLR